MQRSVLVASAVAVLALSAACITYNGPSSYNPCGASGQECCTTGSACNSGLTCASGTCQTVDFKCGASGQPCCTTGGDGCDGGLVCASGTCGECATDSDCYYLIGYNDPSTVACCNQQCFKIGECGALDRATCTIGAGPDGGGCSVSGWTDMGPWGICCGGDCLEVSTCP